MNTMKRKLPYENFRINNPEETLVEIGRLIYKRKLTDSCGGNISMRYKNKIYMSPTYSAEYFQWDIPGENIIIFNQDRKLLRGKKEEVSREYMLHLKIYESFKDINGIIHAHPSNLMALSLIQDEIKAEIQTMINRKCPVIGMCNPNLAELSEEQNEDIVSIFKRRSEMDEPMSLSVIFKAHGVIVAEVNIFKALSLLEAIEVNAKAIIINRIINCQKEK